MLRLHSLCDRHGARRWRRASRLVSPATCNSLYPKQATLAVGVEWSVYFDNIVLTQSPEDFQYGVDCEIGKTEPRRLERHSQCEASWRSRVHGSGHRQRRKRCCRWVHATSRVASAFRSTRTAEDHVCGRQPNARLTRYPNEVAWLLSQAPLIDWKMLGTHRPPSAEENVAHEGYGGWTWQRFAEKYEADPDGTHRKRSSPFVFLSDGKPKLDVCRILRPKVRRRATRRCLLSARDQ